MGRFVEQLRPLGVEALNRAPRDFQERLGKAAVRRCLSETWL
jgi:hypothetical protein